MRKSFFFAISMAYIFGVNAQQNPTNKFSQLGTELATPNVYRTASGAPGPQYWQQRADYEIEIRLDEDNHILYGEETVTYYNNSPDVLDYLWLQLDQNQSALNSDSYKIQESTLSDSMSFGRFENLVPWFDGGFKIEYVQDTKGNDLPYTINKTMMRIDLPQSLVPQGGFSFRIKWYYNINDRAKVGGRSGYELFEAENNALYTIAQFFPRMAVYSDVDGWQHKQFLGSGEFALTFGNYDVKISVPTDHVVAATGELQNSKSILTTAQADRLQRAKTASKPVEIITQAEAEETEKGRSTEMRTWHFKAQNVRDFGWASSRKFIWDAQGEPFGDRTVLAMSYYPKEGNPLWGQYSTAAVVQTLRTYSKHTFDYPYPVAISVNAADIGMEYPMICFNFGRCEPDGTYSERTKYGMIGVIIHEVGHNYFPMIVNSDERQWTWMDEGLNTFLQYLTEQEFQRDYPSRRGEPRNIVDYMKGDKSRISPIMTNSESVHQLGNNAYGKPATALNILRETVMGRELFDFAFKTYANRWKFKHPTPADFFRTMEDASAVDLDWFWRGWFFGTEHVDMSINYVKWYQITESQPAQNKAVQRDKRDQAHPSISAKRNKEDIKQTMVEADSTLQDFYNSYDALQADALDERAYAQTLQNMSEEEKAMLNDKRHFYEVGISNLGGLPMPVILQMKYEDGTEEIIHIPAEIWKMDDTSVSKVLVTEKRITELVLDPYLQTADVDLENNSWPAVAAPSRLQLYKQRERGSSQNEMQRAKKSGQNE